MRKLLQLGIKVELLISNGVFITRAYCTTQLSY
jgi:hypothetical protein